KITDAEIQELIRAAAARAGAPQTTTPAAQSQSATSTAQGGQTKLSLTVDDAIKLALDRNLDIAVQRLNPQTYDFSISNLLSIYRPMLTSTIGRQSTTQASTATLNGLAPGTGIDTDVNPYNGGLSQSRRWGGGSLVATFNNIEQSSTSPTALINPVFQPNWSALYTQPLLRNFKIDSTRRQILVTKLNQDISELQLQQTIINTVSNVRNAYWDDVFGVQSVEVARQSVALAEQLVKDNQTRVEVGTMPPIDVVSAQSQAAASRQALAV